MRFLADENFSSLLVETLRARGHDILWIKETDPGIDDTEVLSLATDQARPLITFDKDFGELIHRVGLNAPFGIILFRLPSASPAVTAQTVVKVLESRTDWAGHFSVVDENRIRTKPMPNL